MRLSRETEYAFQALVFLVQQGEGAVIQLADIASERGIPPSFLSKIFQNLTHHGLVRSHRGRLRGYSLGRAAHEINLREVLEATEGPDLLDRCAFWQDACRGEANPCALHDVWKKSRTLLQEEVKGLTLRDLAERRAVAPQKRPPIPAMEVRRWKSGKRRERSS